MTPSEQQAANAHAEYLRNHWWPRPGWRPRRIMCTWHLTFEHDDQLHELVAGYQRALQDLPGIDLVPKQWLHLTIQGVGYRDELSSPQLDALVKSVRNKVSTIPAFTVTFHKPLVLGEALVLPPHPVAPLHDLLATIRAGITEATQTKLGHAQAFRPHVSLAYSNTDTAARPYIDALEGATAEPVHTRVDHVTLIDQQRQLEPRRLYHWSTRATAPLRQ